MPEHHQVDAFGGVAQVEQLLAGPQLHPLAERQHAGGFIRSQASKKVDVGHGGLSSQMWIRSGYAAAERWERQESTPQPRVPGGRGFRSGAAGLRSERWNAPPWGAPVARQRSAREKPRPSPFPSRPPAPRRAGYPNRASQLRRPDRQPPSRTRSDKHPSATSPFAVTPFRGVTEARRLPKRKCPGMQGLTGNRRGGLT